jgi:hypothetical protein
MFRLVEIVGKACDKCKAGGLASIAIQDDVVGTKMGVFIVSLGLLDLEADNVKEKGESDENKKLMTNSASSSDTKPSVEWLQDAIAKLEAENERYNTSIKANKEQIAYYKKQLQSSDNTVFLRMLSGECVSVITQSQKTIKQFKVQDVNPATGKTDKSYEFILNGDILKNNKRVFGCGIGHNSTVDLVYRQGLVDADADADVPVQPVAVQPVALQPVALQPVPTQAFESSESESDGEKNVFGGFIEMVDGTVLCDHTVADPSVPSLHRLTLEVPTADGSVDIIYVYRPNALAKELYTTIQLMTGIEAKTLASILPVMKVAVSWHFMTTWTTTTSHQTHRSSSSFSLFFAVVS